VRNNYVCRAPLGLFRPKMMNNFIYFYHLQLTIIAALRNSTFYPCHNLNVRRWCHRRSCALCMKNRIILFCNDISQSHVHACGDMFQIRFLVLLKHIQKLLAINKFKAYFLKAFSYNLLGK